MSSTKLPISWSYPELSEILDVKGGFAFKSKDYKKKGIPLLRISNIQNRTISFEKNTVFIEDISDEKLFEYFVSNGDILIALSGATTGKYGIYNLTSQAVLNQRVGRLKLLSIDKIYSKYIYYYLDVIRESILEKAYGAAQPNISPTVLSSFKIPLPPLNEQHRIVEKIEELFTKSDAAVTELQNVKKQLKRYRQSVLKSAFEGKLTEEWRRDSKYTDRGKLLKTMNTIRKNEFDKLEKRESRIKNYSQIICDENDFNNLPKLPKNWFWNSIDIVASLRKHSIKAGPFGSSLKKSMYVSEGYKIYGQEQVIKNNHEYGDYYIDENKFNELISCSIKPKDILISLVGTIGKVLILPEDCKLGIINPRLVKVTLNKDLMLPDYFKYYFESEFAKSLYKLKSHGATMDILNLKIILDEPFPICEIEEQQKIVEEIESRLSVADKIEEEIDRNLKKTVQLRQSILKKAFEGKLVPQDPNDEPAEKLLERIKKEKNKHGVNK